VRNKKQQKQEQEERSRSGSRRGEWHYFRGLLYSKVEGMAHNGTGWPTHSKKQKNKARADEGGVRRKKDWRG